jgi:RAQPRD family integrative conjugative element protein
VHISSTSPEKAIHHTSGFLLNDLTSGLILFPDPHGTCIMPMTLFRCLLLLLTVIVHGSSYAASAHEQSQFSLILQQLDTIEHLATRAETASTSEPDERYRFDYPRLSKDLQRIRQGIQGYLSPSRAQARDPGELVGDYRLDTPSTEPSP